MRTKFSGFLTLLLAFVVQITFAQEKTVTGTVTDDEGLPLPGVNVIVDGTSSGTQSDFDGNYTINVEVGETLTFSYVGFQTQNIQVGDSNTIDVQMSAGSELEEVIVTGYSSFNRETYNGSISTVKSEDIDLVPIASFDQILQGKAPGLQVSAGSGQPGSAARVRIRGNGSINGSNEPLYIVDGIQIQAGDYATLNPNDFERVDVLKDANATALYGSRGANGVIVITTKKGAFSQATTFTYKASLGFSEIGRQRFEMMNSRQLLEFQRTINRGTGAGLSDAEISELAQVNTDWSDLFFRTGTTQLHELNMSGGNENTRFFSSVQYFEQDGISKRSKLQRFVLRNNLNHRPDEKTNIGINSQIGFSKSLFVDSENSVTLQNPYAAVYLGTPFHSLYNEDGSYNTGSGRVGVNAYENLLVNDQSANKLKLLLNGFAEREIFDNVTAKVNIGVDYEQTNSIRVQDPSTNYGSTVTPGGEGLYSEGNSYEAYITSTTSLGYNNVFNDVHSIGINGYLEYVKTHFRSSGFTGYGINPLLVGYASGITPGSVENELIPTTRGTVIENGLFSYFGVADYDYDSKYGLSATLRRDSSSKFADANKWGTFWSVAGRWNIDNEDFLKDSNFINALKLRASYGTVGNQAAIPDYAYATTYGQTSYNGFTGVAPGNPGNPDLKWETSQQFNVALDYALWDNRISGALEFYNNKTVDLFITRNLSATSGFTSIDANDGTMRNRGIEFSVNANVVKNEDLSVNLFANLSYNKNEILDLGQVNEFEQGTSIIREGLPLGTHYVVGWAGVNPANGEPLYTDLDGNITNTYSEENSRADFGSFNPEYTGGFGGDITYKGFTLSSLFSFQAEYFRFNNQTFFSENPNFAQYNLSTAMLDMWQQPGDITEIQSFRYNREFSSKDIEDASFLRLRQVMLSYNFSPETLKNLKHFKGLRIYAMGTNLYTWTKFTGFDPEDDNNIAQFEYPTPRTITFGVDLKF